MQTTYVDAARNSSVEFGLQKLDIIMRKMRLDAIIMIIRDVMLEIALHAITGINRRNAITDSNTA